MVLSIVNKILLFIMLGFLVFSLYNTIEEMDNKEELYQEITGNPINTTKGLLLFWYGYSGTTPSYVNDWLPKWIHPKNKFSYMIEDVPLPDSTDLLIIIPLILITFWILRRFDYFKHGQGLIWSIIIMLLVIIISWVTLKIIHYELMMQGIQSLGLNKEIVLANRMEINQGVKNYVPTFIILFLFTSMAVIKLYAGLFKKKK